MKIDQNWRSSWNPISLTKSFQKARSFDRHFCELWSLWGGGQRGLWPWRQESWIFIQPCYIDLMVIFASVSFLSGAGVPLYKIRNCATWCLHHSQYWHFWVLFKEEVGCSLLLPLSTLCPCCLLCLLYKWHLSVEIRGPGDFPVGTEVGGAKSLAQGVGAVLIQTVYPFCPSGVSDTGFRDFRMTACVQGWEKWKLVFKLADV